MENEFYDGWLFPEAGSKHEDVLIDFLYSDYKLFPLWGSVSSGKTVSSSQAWAGLIEQTPKQYPFAMIGKTELTLEANVLDPLTDFLGSKNCYKSGNVAYIYGHKVRLYGANDAKSRSKIQGKSLYAWYGDEVTTWPEDFFMMALSRLRVGKAKAIMTMNPESKFHWFHKQVIERADNPAIKAKLYHFTMEDNPHLPDDYKAWISSMYVPGTVWYKRWIQGEWATAEGAIFPFLSDDPKDGYVIDELPDMSRYVCAMDYGQQHPTCMGLAGYSPSKKQWIVIKEFYTANKTNTAYSHEFAREMLADHKLEYVDVDSGGGGLSLIMQLRADYPELNIKHAIKSDVGKELQDLASSLFLHKMAIYKPGCPRLVEELMNYVYDDKAKDNGQDEPLKKNDDGPDMLRYLHNRVSRI
jgi:PBSX family phage terminase large subunit